MTMTENLKCIKQQICEAEYTCGRTPNSVTLLAVSKTQSPDKIRDAFAAGQHAFGENYYQEALNKIRSLSDLAIEWHFIGPIQSNKTRGIAEHFNWVHSVDRFKIAKRLSEQRPAHLAPLNICIQINIGNEASKAGVSPAELNDLLSAINALANINVRGLMTIPMPGKTLSEQRQTFRAMHDLLKSVNIPLDTLSMGMSDDFQAAIAEGSTIVRIGSAIFGRRE